METETIDTLPMVEKPEHGRLGWEYIRHRYVPFSTDIGVGPYFTNLLMKRIHQQKPCNLVISGEAGSSKTYSCISLARDVQPNFSVNQVAFTFSEYMKLQIDLPEGYVIVLDEPEYTAAGRDWYRDINRALIATTRSARFRVHPLFIPCLNKSMLDKIIRKYLLQWLCWMTDRGKGIVYQIQPSRFDESVVHKPLCNLRIEMLDGAKCDKPWCYSCDKIDTCNLIRAQYERKRREIQLSRYKEDLEFGQKKEALELSVAQLEDMALKFKDEISRLRSGFISLQSLQLLFESKYGLKLNDSKARNLARRLDIKLGYRT